MQPSRTSWPPASTWELYAAFFISTGFILHLSCGAGTLACAPSTSNDNYFRATCIF